LIVRRHHWQTKNKQFSLKTLQVGRSSFLSGPTYPVNNSIKLK